MKVSVVIPTFNGGRRFKEVLQRILSQKLEFPFEVLCVDSGSGDGTPEFAAASGARVLPIDPSSFNHGLTRNLGIRETDGDPVVLIVQDAMPLNEHWLDALTRAVVQDERTAGGYSSQVPREGCDPIIKDRLMNWAACRPAKVVQELPPDGRFEEMPPLEKLALISFDNVSSCVRRGVWEKHPFPERSFGEDVAWALEVIRAGFRIVYEPSSKVVHSHDKSVWYEFKRIYADHQNLNQLIGLATVPGFRHIFSNARGAFKHYRKLIRESDLSEFRKGFRILRAIPYAFLENLAQYLGPKCLKKMEDSGRGGFLLDKWIKKGL